VQWFERQYWGAKSERRALETLNLGQQLWLGLELLPTPVEPPPRTTSVRPSVPRWGETDPLRELE
jgi:hypothetical protein